MLTTPYSVYGVLLLTGMKVALFNFWSRYWGSTVIGVCFGDIVFEMWDCGMISWEASGTISASTVCTPKYIG